MSVKTRPTVATTQKWIFLILSYMMGLYPKMTQLDGNFRQVLRCHGNGQKLFLAYLVIFLDFRSEIFNF